jgi:hypothetical protein
MVARSEEEVSSGAAVVVSARPEQLALFDEGRDDRFPVDVVLSLPMAGNVIYDVAAQDGTTVKVEARRAGAPLYQPVRRLFCGLAPGALANAFARPDAQ